MLLFRVEIKESEKINKCMDLTRELRKLWNMKVTVIPIVISVLGMVLKGLERGLEELEIRRWIETIQTKTWLSTEKRPGDLKRLAVTQTPVKYH